MTYRIEYNWARHVVVSKRVILTILKQSMKLILSRWLEDCSANSSGPRNLIKMAFQFVGSRISPQEIRVFREESHGKGDVSNRWNFNVRQNSAKFRQISPNFVKFRHFHFFNFVIASELDIFSKEKLESIFTNESDLDPQIRAEQTLNHIRTTQDNVNVSVVLLVRVCVMSVSMNRMCILFAWCYLRLYMFLASVHVSECTLNALFVYSVCMRV